MSRSSRSDVIDLDVKVHHATELAVLVSETGDKDDAVWLPLSQIEIDTTENGAETTVTIPEWLADEKGLT